MAWTNIQCNQSRVISATRKPLQQLWLTMWLFPRAPIFIQNTSAWKYSCGRSVDNTLRNVCSPQDSTWVVLLIMEVSEPFHRSWMGSRTTNPRSVLPSALLEATHTLECNMRTSAGVAGTGTTNMGVLMTVSATCLVPATTILSVVTLTETPSIELVSNPVNPELITKVQWIVFRQQSTAQRAGLNAARNLRSENWVDTSFILAWRKYK